MSPYYRFIPSYTQLFPLTVGHNVNLNKLQAVLIDVTSGHVTSGSTPSQHPLKCDFVRPHILLRSNMLNIGVHILDLCANIKSS